MLKVVKFITNILSKDLFSKFRGWGNTINNGRVRAGKIDVGEEEAVGMTSNL